ncbi:MAG TPA: hypothetical protein VFJ57_06065 [Solirubrobacterales bacterium]|nr:hypothetical protein [Solirubrobacterales bacterium]
MRSGRLTVLLLTAVLLWPASATAAGPPTIPTAWVTAVTTSSAVLRAEVNPGGLSTRYRFEYLTLAAYEANVAASRDPFAGASSVPPAGSAAGAGTVPVAVSFTLVAPANPLAPGTAYRYRVLASNEAGTAATAAHQLRTQSATPLRGLPDGRAWELVSPVDKGGGAIAGPGVLFGGGEIQAAVGGGALTYGSATAFAEPVAAPPASQYVSRRGAGGWATANVSPPLESGGYGDHPDGVPFRFFSPDLERALMLNGSRCAAQGTCPPSYSVWSAGSLQPLPTAPGLSFEGADADLGVAFFAAEAGLYRWSGGALEQISPVPGATLAAPLGAVSNDGSRAYLTLPADRSIHLYEAGAGTRLVPESAGGGAAFQAASADGALAYFTRAGTLYRYSAVAGASTPIAAGVVGVLAVSADGAYVYYQGGAGLELWHEGAVRQVAAGADAALAGDYPPATASARLSADGEVLAFLSAAPIAGYDNTDANTGLPDTEAYLYDAGTDTLLCASCNPTGERPAGSSSIPGALVNGTTIAYRSRALSASGRRLFFDSADALVVGDTNALPDVYEWEALGEGSCAEAPGCVSLISGGRGEGGSFLDASADGADAFLLTGDSLLASDPGSIDVYDARVGGGLPEPQTPIPCIADACQPLPSPPEDPASATSVAGPGNPAPRYAKEARHHRKHHRHKHKTRHRGGPR